MILEFPIGSRYINKDIYGYKIELRCCDIDDVSREIEILQGNKMKAHNIPLQSTIDILDKCARLWLNRSYSKKHIEMLSKILNQSPELVTVELENIVKLLLKENMERVIEEELGDKNILDGWVKTSYGSVHRQPRGLVFHNLSGNAFIVIAVSIAAGLLSKNCNLVKVSSDEPYFAYAFFQSLCEIDSSIKDRLSVMYFDSSRSDIYREIIKKSDCIIHWGGEHSRNAMASLCAEYNTHFIEHGPKVSFEVVETIDDIKNDTLLIARDIVFWEQRACLSPRIIFINKNIDAEDFAVHLSSALKDMMSVFPKHYANPWDVVKIIQDRQYCIVKYGINGLGKVFASENADYTVVLSEEMPSAKDIDRCFGRFVFVCPFNSKDEVLNYVEKNIKQYLQTMGYKGDDEDFIEKMTLLGVSIVTRIGEMPMHLPGTSHDGYSNLHEMTYSVSKQL